MLQEYGLDGQWRVDWVYNGSVLLQRGQDVSVEWCLEWGLHVLWDGICNAGTFELGFSGFGIFLVIC